MTRVYFLWRSIDLTTTFCLSRRIPCVLHKILRSKVVSMAIWPQSQLRADLFFAMSTRPSPIPQHTFGEPPRFWETHYQREPGSFLNDNGGRESAAGKLNQGLPGTNSTSGGLEPGISGSQGKRPNHWATLPPTRLKGTLHDI